MKKENEKWLDELISRTIDTEKPEFDAEKWQTQFPEEFQILKSRAKQTSSAGQPNMWRIIYKSKIAKLAAAAVIVIGVGFFIVHLGPDEQVDTGKVTEVAKSPVEMMTAMSLERAFWRGGIEAVEKQCKQAFKPTGPRSGSLSVEQILAEFNGDGKSSERSRL